MNQTKQSYVGIRVTDNHHMTIAFVGKRLIDEKLKNAIDKLPFPAKFNFGDIIMLGENNDIEAITIICENDIVDKSIRAFHRQFVEPGHISEKELKLHVTTKGCAAELKRIGSFVANVVYIKNLGNKYPSYIKFYDEKIDI